MKPVVKWMIILLAVPVVLVALLLGALKLMVTEEAIRTAVVPVVEEQTGRTLTVQKAGLDVFPSVEVVLQGVSLSEDPAFGAGPFVSLNEFRVNVDVWALISGEVVVEDILVDGLSVQVRRHPDGTFNFTSMIPASSDSAVTDTPVPDTAPADTVKSAPPSIRLESVQVRNARLIYEDLKENTSVSVNHLDYDLSLDLKNDAIHLAHLLSVGSLSASLAAGTVADKISLTLDQDLTATLDGKSVTITRSAFRLNEMDVNVSGSVNAVSDSTWMTDLSIETGEIGLKPLLSLVPVSLVKEAASVTAGGSFSFRATVNGLAGGSAIPQVTYRLDLKNGSIQYAGFPASLSGLTVLLAGTENNLDTLKVLGAVAGSRFDVDASVKNFADPVVKIGVNANLNTADIKSFYPLGDSLDLAGTIQSSFQIEGPALDPKKLNGSGSVVFNNLKIAQKGYLPGAIRELNGRFDINKSVAELKNFQVRIGESDVLLNSKVENYLGLVLKPEGQPLVPTMTGSLVSNKLFVGDFVDLSAVPTEDVQPVPADTTRLRVPVLPEFLATFSAKIGEFRYLDIKATGITTTLTIRDQTIRLSGTRATFLGGTITLDGLVGLKAPTGADYDFSFRADRLNSDEALATFPVIESYVKMSPYLDGTLSSQLGVKGALNDSLAPVLNSVTALGTAGIPSGVLAGHPIQSAIATFLQSPGLNRLELTNFQTGLEIKEGKLYVNNLNTTAGATEVQASGWQALDQSISYEVTLFLPPGMSDGLNGSEYGKLVNQSVTDSKNRVIVDLLVGGTFLSPTIKPDPKKTALRAAKAVGQKINEEITKKTEEVKQEVQKQVDTATEAAKKQAEEAKRKLKIRFP